VAKMGGSADASERGGGVVAKMGGSADAAERGGGVVAKMGGGVVAKWGGGVVAKGGWCLKADDVNAVGGGGVALPLMPTSGRLWCRRSSGSSAAAAGTFCPCQLFLVNMCVYVRTYMLRFYSLCTHWR
jgi:hypothetical protein